MAKYIVKIGTTLSQVAYGNTGGIEIPVGSSYKTTTQTLVDSGRNTQGVFVGSIVRQTVRKIEMSWRVIDAVAYSTLATFFNTNFTFYVSYFDTDSNTRKTGQFYVGDRKVQAVENKQLFCPDPLNQPNLWKPQYYENFSLSLIEV